MAEIVSVLLDKLIPVISEQANLLIGIHREVESVKDELESTASFLVQADAREARGDSNETLRSWVKQVREVAYRIEDVMDEYLYFVARRSQKQGFYRLVRMTDRSVRKLLTRHGIASKIADIKNDVVEIKNRADRYGLIASSSTQQQQQTTSRSQIASLFCREDELVGIDGPRNELSSWLEEDQGGKRTVFSVVGMGGLGKTTLTRKVYDSRIGRFDCYAWITVSQTFIEQELLKSIIRQFYQTQKEAAPEGIETMNEIDLVMKLHAYVEQKRYMVVFDDVWNSGLGENMMLALPENNKSSRIIFTTRIEDLAPSTAQSSLCRVYKMPFLSFQESFEPLSKRVFQTSNKQEKLLRLLKLEDLSEEMSELFCKSGFRTCNQELEGLSDEEAFELFCKRVAQTCKQEPEDLLCPPELRELTEGIVKKCDGLPLAIVTVGGVLSRKEKNISEWKKVHDSLGSKLQSDQQMTRVLSLSYHDLSPNLKSCLLYLSIYPEDCSIRCSRLIRQWIAEGFVNSKNNQEPEDVAGEYLSELIRRCVVQVSEVDDRNIVRECRVHDLIREFILFKSEGMRFSGVFGETIDGKCRRLSMARDDLNMNVKVSLIRSLFVFQRNEFSKDFMRVLFGNLKLVTVLDFEGSGVKLLPESVGDLFHLKYLSVRNTVVEELPKSIGRLKQLETLDMKRSRVRQLPIEIKRLRKLRHLLAYSYNEGIDLRQGVQIQEGLGCWETLQKIRDVEANSGTIIKDLVKFTKLRRLGISKVRSEDVMELCKAIEKMRELRAVEIIAVDAQQVLDLESIHSPPPFLQTLSLRGRLEANPSWIAKLQNLVRLQLRWSGLKDDHFGVLQNLPNLLDLMIMDDAYGGDQLHIIKRGGFPKLKSLTLEKLKLLQHLRIEQGALLCLQLLDLSTLDELKHLTIEQGALPSLQKMYMGPVSPQMMEVPSSIQHLTNLKLMMFVDFSEELFMKMVPEGPSWSIIQHIPTVRFALSIYHTDKYDYYTPANYQDRKVNE